MGHYQIHKMLYVAGLEKRSIIINFVDLNSVMLYITITSVIYLIAHVTAAYNIIDYYFIVFNINTQVYINNIYSINET